MLKADKFADLAKRGFENRALIREHVKNMAPAEVDAFYKAVVNSPEALGDVKAALIDTAVEGALAAPESSAHKALGATLDEWADNGMTKFFDFKELRALKGLESYMRFSATGIDSGTRLVTAAAIGGLKRFSLSSVGVILHTVGIGRILMTNTMQRFMLGAGAKPVNLSGFRAFAAALAASQNEIGQE